MKLYLQYKLKDCGKSKFLSRLIPALKKIGVKTQFKEKGADVALLLTRAREKFPKIPTCVRMEGITILKNKKDEDRAKKILKSVNKCDAIIYQSEFCKYMLNGILKPKVKKQFIIYNGADPKEFDVKPAEHQYYRNVIIAAKWFDGKRYRDYKRLRQMWECAVQYVNIQSGTTNFWIAGETGGIEKAWPKHDRIQFLGHLDDKTLKSYFKASQVYLHMPWYSWCDNSLIEAISAGCTPVVSNNGGNAEVADDCNGIVLDLDRKISAKRTNNGPPPLNAYKVMEGINEAYNSMREVSQEPIHIGRIAQKYKEVFECIR